MDNGLVCNAQWHNRKLSLISATGIEPALLDTTEMPFYYNYLEKYSKLYDAHVHVKHPNIKVILLRTLFVNISYSFTKLFWQRRPSSLTYIVHEHKSAERIRQKPTIPSSVHTNGEIASQCNAGWLDSVQVFRQVCPMRRCNPTRTTRQQQHLLQIDYARETVSQSLFSLVVQVFRFSCGILLKPRLGSGGAALVQQIFPFRDDCWVLLGSRRSAWHGTKHSNNRASAALRSVALSVQFGRFFALVESVVSFRKHLIRWMLHERIARAVKFRNVRDRLQ